MRFARCLILLCVLLVVLFLGLTPSALAAPSVDGIHVVQRGETLSAIARQYGVSVDALVTANGLADSSLIRVGQRLVIPDPSVVTTDSLSSSTVYIVAHGDTLSSVAARHGVTVRALIDANAITDPSRLHVGQRLEIPPPAPQAQTSQTGTDQTEAAAVVQPGDTLAAIALRYGTTVAALTATNGLNNPALIRPGQRLIIPSADDAHVGVQTGLRMDVSINEQRCRVYRANSLLYDWPCSTGRPGAGTRVGTFYVQSKIREAWGSAWSFWMPYWLGIYWAGSTENGIHGLPYEEGGLPVWGNAVGTPVTYGCVLLGDWEAQTLWQMAYIGMPVNIAY